MFYGCAIIPTAIWGASLVLWVGVHSSLRGLRTLGSIRPWSRTVGSIAATGDGNYGAGRLTCRLWTDPTTHRQHPTEDAGRCCVRRVPAQPCSGGGAGNEDALH